MRSVLILGNANSDEGRNGIAEVEAALRARGVDAEVVAAPSPGASLDAARRAVTNGVERIVAVGGDGAVHLAVNAIDGSDVVLGVVPAGTGNDFARALGLLDGDIVEQVDRALAEPVAVDAIRTDHGWVATVATLGFSGDVTARANELRWPRGAHRYTVATLLQLPRLRTIDVTVTIDGDRVGGDTTLLAVGSTAWFGGGMKICPAARPDDGLLHAVNIAAVSRRRFVRVFPTVFSGGHVERDEVATASGRAALIDGPPDVDLWGDGERLGPLPVRLDLVPGALRVAGAHPSDR